MSDAVFKIASRPQEFEQIHELNNETFAREIPQLAPDPSGRLIDQFHSENTYVIALDAANLLTAMVAMRSVRPFSLDIKLNQPLESFLPAHDSVVEFRKLAVRKENRSAKLIGGLFQLLAKVCQDRGHDLAVISATTRQLRLYRNLAFQPFASPVGEENALFQPMYLELETIKERLPWAFQTDH